MIALVTGFIAGLGHVFAGPDHLAAVAPLAVASMVWPSEDIETEVQRRFDCTACQVQLDRRVSAM